MAWIGAASWDDVELEEDFLPLRFHPLHFPQLRSFDFKISEVNELLEYQFAVRLLTSNDCWNRIVVARVFPNSKNPTLNLSVFFSFYRGRIRVSLLGKIRFELTNRNPILRELMRCQ